VPQRVPLAMQLGCCRLCAVVCPSGFAVFWRRVASGLASSGADHEADLLAYQYKGRAIGEEASR
jgi:hypothetical protein